MDIAGSFDIHRVFDLLAWLCAVTSGFLVCRWNLLSTLISAPRPSYSLVYFTVLMTGSVCGAFAFGTLNLYLSGIPLVGKSILGSLVGAILAIELFKPFAGLRHSTGFVFVIPFCILVTIGRLGCFFAGLPDNTFGTETHMPWGVDFGDNVRRHPVQIYESLSMTVFLAYALWRLGADPAGFRRKSFYLMVMWYGAQRFLWEFLKPYGDLYGPLNLFHFLSLALIVYGTVQLMRDRHSGPKAKPVHILRTDNFSL